MDGLLAELYGTNEPTDEGFEKVAHLDFLEKIAEEEGIDLDELSDEDLEELADVAAEALDKAEEEGEEYEDEGEEYVDEDDMEKEAEAKVEEADFLGRVMAHSFNQELDTIDMEKDAGARTQRAKAAIGGAWRRTKGVAVEGKRRVARRRPFEPSTLGGRMKKRVRKAAYRADKAARGLGRRLGAESTGAGVRRGAKAGRAEARPGGRARRALDRLTFGKSRRAVGGARRGAAEAMRSQRRRGYGAAGGAAALGLGAAGGAAAYANREKKSADEMWEDAIQTRAWEHLMAAGLADDQGNYIPSDKVMDKTAGEEDLDYEVDAAALELLEAEGYPVEWY